MSPGICLVLIKTYEFHEEDPVRKRFFSVTRDEQNHEITCGLAITQDARPPGPITNQPKTELGKRLQRTCSGCTSMARATERLQVGARPSTTCGCLFSSFPRARSPPPPSSSRCSTTPASRLQGRLQEHRPRRRTPHGDLHGGDGARLPGPQGIEMKSPATEQIRAGYLFLSAVLFQPPMEFSGTSPPTSSPTSARPRKSPACWLRHSHLRDGART